MGDFTASLSEALFQIKKEDGDLRCVSVVMVLA